MSTHRTPTTTPSEETPLSSGRDGRSQNSPRLHSSNQKEYQALSFHQNSSESLPTTVADATTTAEDSSSRQQKRRGRILLFVVSFLYGTLNVSLRLVYAMDDPPSASALSTVRGWLAVICFIPFVMQKNSGASSGTESTQQHGLIANSTRQQRPLWMVSFELALLNFGAQALLNVSLLFIASARAAFLTETSVVMTPLISAIAGHSVRWTVWLACLAAMMGLVILSDNDDGLGNFSFGDFLVLGGALSWSLYLFRLSQCGAYNEVDMQALKTVFLACLYTLWFLISQWQSSVLLWTGYATLAAWLLLFYSALGPGAVADVIQQKAQASIAAPEANVILAMEPLFTSILGFVLLSEALTLTEVFGGGFLIAAAILATR
uniref:EamA domain-containing protein n=1 Tax=Entomoneis paludosa TaxID=265537 RepID=A0A7S2V7U9_9STRA|mmetsp:Transcript_11403/g.23373  ORF Transcript_11403/g.23373 Transcript_11403/m.23373 type:complete len:377 (+) Transcript_11403:91-1221(+)